MPNSVNPKNFLPKNRRLLISSIKPEEKTETGVLLPTNYSQATNKHTMVEVLSVSSDCAIFNPYNKGFYAVVDTHMIETIEIAGKSYETILENYVIGTLEL